MHHGDPVGERQELVEILRDQHHAGAAPARLEQAAVHLGRRADVEAAGRLVRPGSRAGSRSSTRARITFCMLPPERRRIGASGAGQRMSIGRDRLPGPLAHPLAAQEAAGAAPRASPRVSSDQVLGDGQRADDAIAVAVLRDAGDAGGESWPAATAS